MRELHVIQGPNLRNARKKIAFFALHAFVAIRVSSKLHNCHACDCNSKVAMRIASPSCRAQLLLVEIVD